MSTCTSTISNNRPIASNKVFTKTRIQNNSLNNKNIQDITEAGKLINNSINSILHSFLEMKRCLEKAHKIVVFSALGYVSMLAFNAIHGQCCLNPAIANSVVTKVAETISLLIVGGTLLTNVKIAMSI